MLWGVLADLREELVQDPRSLQCVGVAALLVAHNCFEVYLNYAGEVLLPHVWANERRSFGSEPHRGVMGKCHRLADELSVTLDRGRRPYRGVRQLQVWRNRVVHPKVERMERIVSFADTTYLKNLQTQFFQQVTLKFVDSVTADVESLCDLIQTAAHRQHPRKFLGPGSFKGILGMTGGSIPVNEREQPGRLWSTWK
jgi:hypothetical protein